MFVFGVEILIEGSSSGEVIILLLTFLFIGVSSSEETVFIGDFVLLFFLHFLDTKCFNIITFGTILPHCLHFIFPSLFEMLFGLVFLNCVIGELLGELLIGDFLGELLTGDFLGELLTGDFLGENPLCLLIISCFNSSMVIRSIFVFPEYNLFFVIYDISSFLPPFQFSTDNLSILF